MPPILSGDFAFALGAEASQIRIFLNLLIPLVECNGALVWPETKEYQHSRALDDGRQAYKYARRAELEKVYHNGGNTQDRRQ
jgi:hydroxymethylpyrimidine pyrophosphatase-like HAD family hydrolase